MLQLREVRDAYVSIPGRGRVRGGEITIAEWEARDTLFLKKERGLAATRRYHRAVIRTLKARHCDSIDEALEKGENDGDR